MKDHAKEKLCTTQKNPNPDTKAKNLHRFRHVVLDLQDGWRQWLCYPDHWPPKLYFWLFQAGKMSTVKKPLSYSARKVSWCCLSRSNTIKSFSWVRKFMPAIIITGWLNIIQSGELGKIKTGPALEQLGEPPLDFKVLTYQATAP